MEPGKVQMMATDGKPRYIDEKKVSEFQEKGWIVAPRYMPEKYYPQYDTSLNKQTQDDPRQTLLQEATGYDEGKLDLLIM